MISRIYDLIARILRRKNVRETRYLLESFVSNKFRWVVPLLKNKNLYFNWMMDRIEHVKPLDVLDAGCGSGYFSLKLLKKGHNVTGVDLKPVGFHRKKFTFIQSDLVDVDFKDSSFDVVTACHILQHIGHVYQNFGKEYGRLEDSKFIEKVYRWLRIGGKFFVVVPISSSFRYVSWTKDFRWRVYDMETLNHLFDKFLCNDNMIFDGACETKVFVDDAKAIVLEFVKIG